MPTKTAPGTPAKEADEAATAAAEAAEARLDKAAKTVEDTAEETAEQTVETVSSAADAAIDGLTIGQQQAMQTMETAGQAMMEGVVRFQREIVDFVSERIRHDMETQQAMLRCRSLDEMRDLQTRFFQTAMDQYAAEASRLMKLGTEVMQRTLEPAD